MRDRTIVSERKKKGSKKERKRERDKGRSDTYEYLRPAAFVVISNSTPINVIH